MVPPGLLNIPTILCVSKVGLHAQVWRGGRGKATVEGEGVGLFHLLMLVLFAWTQQCFTVQAAKNSLNGKKEKKTSPGVKKSRRT